MPTNKYCNLDGTKKIKDEYTKINDGFEDVEIDMNAVNLELDNHKSSDNPAHPASKVSYDDTGNTKVLGDDLQTVMDAVEEELKNIIAGDANAEVGSAHISAWKNKTFVDIDERFESIESGLAINVLDNNLSNNGVTGCAAALNTLATTINVMTYGADVYFPEGEYDIDDDVTLNGKMRLHFAKGAVLNIATGKTIDLNGAEIVKGLDLLFSGSGTVSGTIKNTQIYPEWWGAKGDNSADDTSFIQKINDFIVSTGKKRTLLLNEGSTYKITSTLTINVKYVSIYAVGSKIDATSVSDIAIKFIGGDLNPYYQVDRYITGLYLKGDKTENPNVIGMQFTQVSNKGTAHFNVEKCNIDGFNKGVDILAEAYLVKFISTDIFGCNYCVYRPTGQSNSGENINFTNCAFYNSGTIAYIYGSTDDFYFVNCSFDFSTTAFDIKDASVNMIGGHIEFSGTLSDAIIKLNTNANFMMLGGFILMQGTIPHTRNYIVDMQNFCSASFIGTKMHNLQTSTGYFANKSSDTAIINTYNTKTYSTDNNSMFLSNSSDDNLMSDGGFEGSSIIDDISITGDTATITNRFTGTNIQLAQDATEYNAGAKSLKVTKVNAGQSGFFSIFLPINPSDHKRHRFEFYIKNGTMSGTAYLNVKYALVRYNGDGIPTVMKSKSQGSVDLNMGNYSAWTKKSDYMKTAAPAWATHFLLEFNFNGQTGYCNIDDVFVSKGI